MSTARQGWNGATDIRCCRVPGRYRFYNVANGSLLAEVWVCDGTDDQASTKMRDAIYHAISQYGKALGF